MAVCGPERCQTLKVIVFYIYSCFLVVTFAIETIFMVYIVDVKNVLSLTQTQVELIASMFLLGIFFMLPFYPMYNRLGFYLTNLVSFIITEVGVSLWAIAVHFPKVFGQLPVLVSFFQFLTTNGHDYLWFLVLQVTSEIIPKKHSGKALGVVSSMVCVGQMLFTVIYDAWFAEAEKTSSFFLSMLIVGAAAKVFYVLIYYMTVDGMQTGERLIKDHSDENDTWYGSRDNKNQEKSPKIPYHTEHKKAKQMEITEWQHSETNSQDALQDGGVKPGVEPDDEESVPLTDPRILCSSVIFQLFLWPGAIKMCLGFVYLTNIGLLLQSLNMADKTDLIVIAISVCNLLGRFSSGFIYDKLLYIHRKFWLLAFASTLGIISFLLSAFLADNVAILFVAVVIMGISLGLGYSTIYALGAEIFGVHNNVFVQTSKLSLSGALVLVFSMMIGLIYDHVSETQHPNLPHNVVCYGIACYRTSYLVMGLFSVPVPIAFTLLSYHFKRKMHE